MVVYRFYWRDKKGRDFLVGTLPERRKKPKRITQKSIMNWVKKPYYNTNIDINDIHIKCCLVTNGRIVCQPEDEFDSIMMKLIEPGSPKKRRRATI